MVRRPLPGLIAGAAAATPITALKVVMSLVPLRSIFIAPRILVQMKGSEAAVRLADQRAKTRARHEADRYANIPAFTEDMPVQDEPGYDPAEDAPVASGPPPAREQRAPEPTGRGRNVPESHRPVQPSAASGRQQPSRQPKSKRGKK